MASLLSSFNIFVLDWWTILFSCLVIVLSIYFFNHPKPESNKLNERSLHKKQKLRTIIPYSVQLGEQGKSIFWQERSMNSRNEITKSENSVVYSMILKSCLSGTKTTETANASNESFVVLEGSVIYCDHMNHLLMRVMAHLAEPIPLTSQPNRYKYSDMCICYHRARLSHFSRSVMDAELFCIQEEILNLNDKCSLDSSMTTTKRIVSINISQPSKEPFVISYGYQYYAHPRVSFNGEWCSFICCEENLKKNDKISQQEIPSHIELRIVGLDKETGQLNGIHFNVVNVNKDPSSTFPTITGYSHPKWAHNGNLYFLGQQSLKRQTSTMNFVKNILCCLPSSSLSISQNQPSQTSITPSSQSSLIIKSYKVFPNINNSTVSSISNFCIFANNDILMLHQIIDPTTNKAHGNKLFVCFHDDGGDKAIETTTCSYQEIICPNLPIRIDSICCDESSMGEIFYLVGGSIFEVEEEEKNSDLFEVSLNSNTNEYSCVSVFEKYGSNTKSNL